jgi:hypothetical protein
MPGKSGEINFHPPGESCLPPGVTQSNNLHESRAEVIDFYPPTSSLSTSIERCRRPQVDSEIPMFTVWEITHRPATVRTPACRC